MTPRELERQLRKNGMSRKQALTAVSEARRQGLTQEPVEVLKWIEKLPKRT